MSRITIVGSGASGVHFAQTVLEKGHEVTMLDVGFSGPDSVRPELDFNGLKCLLSDPSRYFLGDRFESVVPPEYSHEIYGFPPNKQFIFEAPAGFKSASDGFDPLFSFARGGLAEAWTAGSYPFNDHDLRDFPIDYSDLAPYYDKVAERIGIMGEEDDLAQFFPVHKHLLPPLELDQHSLLLQNKYRQQRTAVNEKNGIFFGRTRVAVLSREKDGRAPCDYSGRCLWGCPSDSLYVPSLTLAQCLKNPAFTYIPNQRVTHFTLDGQNHISHVVARSVLDGKETEFPVENLVLAAGTLSSSMIYMESIYRHHGEIIRLPGLMDNRQILVPFINLKLIGKQYRPASYQYHQLAIGFVSELDNEYVHGQITTLKSALMQPVLQGMPLDWKTASFLGRNLHAALGVININLSDYRRPDNYLTLSPRNGNESELRIQYRPAADENRKANHAIKRVKKFMSRMGLLIPPGQIHLRPMGASVHYSGTLPMSKEAGPHKVNSECRSYDFANLFFADGSSFPFLPAKNLTLTLMANATRIADKVF